MTSILRTIAVFFFAYNLAVFTSLLLGTMDARKLFILWAIYAVLIHAVLRAMRKYSTRGGSG